MTSRAAITTSRANLQRRTALLLTSTAILPVLVMTLSPDGDRWIPRRCSMHLPAPPFVNRSSTVANFNDLLPLSVTPKQGFSGTVALTCSVSSSLSGFTCGFDNPTVIPPGTRTLVIQPSATQVAETGTVTVVGTSGSQTSSMVVNVTVTVPDLQITAGNSTETVIAGSSSSDTISVTSLNGFIGNVSLSCVGTTGLTCSLSPNSLIVAPSPLVTSTLTVTASSSASTGSVTITATSGTLTRNLQIPVTVTVAIP